MKSIAKFRENRYESASSLSQDIERYLRNEPVSAGPPTAKYRIKKFYRRNRAKVLVGSAFAVSLVLGLIGTSIGYWKAKTQEFALLQEIKRADLALKAEAEQRLIADNAVEQENSAKLEAVQKRQEAERNLAFSKKGIEILTSLFEDITRTRTTKPFPSFGEAMSTRLLKAVEELNKSEWVNRWMWRCYRASLAWPCSNWNVRKVCEACRDFFQDA